MEMKGKVKPLQLGLWHGTKGTAPANIYTKDGLNIVYANDGMWGKGIYFAANANYSCSPGFAFHVPGQLRTYEAFFTNVAIGNPCDMPSTKGLFCPPLLPGRANQYYDSVKGNA
jgi:hypothetical protein